MLALRFIIRGTHSSSPTPLPLLTSGNRSKRQDDTFMRKIPSRIIRNLTGVIIRDYGCTLKVFRKDAAKNLGLYGELHRFIPILAVMQGARIPMLMSRTIRVNSASRSMGWGELSK